MRCEPLRGNFFKREGGVIGREEERRSEGDGERGREVSAKERKGGRAMRNIFRVL